jgi:hypothetical protein
MPHTLASLTDYQDWLNTIKQRVVSARLRVALAANSELIRFLLGPGGADCRETGPAPVGRQTHYPTVGRPAKGLSRPEAACHPRTSSIACASFTSTAPLGHWTPSTTPPEPIGQQAVDQIPWGHNILIFTKCSSVIEADFYIRQTIEQGWSRDVLALQLKTKLYGRAGKAVTNSPPVVGSGWKPLAVRRLKRGVLITIDALNL